MLKSDYTAKHRRRMILFEKQFTKPIFEALQKQIAEVVADLRKDGLEATKQRLDRIVINDSIGKVVRELYLTVGLYFIKKTLVELHQPELKDSGFSQNEQWIADLISYFKTELLTKVVIPISNETKNQV